MAAGKKYRVIQWATGNVGSRSLRTVIEHPELELVGLWVSSDAKAGKDAGELAGIGPVGIKATTSADELIATDADCVIYMPQYLDWDVLCALLASGKNVVTTRGELLNPDMLQADRRAQVEEACRKGNSSTYATGSSPGFISEALSIPLLSMQRRLDCLTIDEFANNETRNSPEMLFDIMGFGSPLENFDPNRFADHLRHEFANSLNVVAKAMGLAFDEVEAFGEAAPLAEDVVIAAGPVARGTLGGTRTTIVGKHKGKPVMRFRATWYITDKVDAPEWNLRDSGWRVTIEGDTPMSFEITYPKMSPEEYAAFTPGLTAHRAVNAVPILCEAESGMRTTVDLPQIIPHLER